MTLFFEVSPPWQWRPGLHVHKTMIRVVWGPFAAAVLRVPFKDFATHAYRWRDA